MTEDTLTVVQSVSRWLTQTQTWLYQQVRFLPDDIVSHVVCEASLNLDQFPYPRVHALADEPGWRIVWDKGVRKLRLRRHLNYLVRNARAVDARLVHSHFGDYAWQDIGGARAAGARHVVTFYGFDVMQLPTAQPIWYERYRELFATADRVLCEGAHMARTIVELGCPADKVTVHHLGVDLEQIPFEPRSWSPGEPLRVLMSGSFREKKGFPYGLRALAALRHDVPVEVTIIGDEHNEATRREKRIILATIEKGGLTACTRLLGFQPYDAVLSEARKHHVFLAPSVTSSDGDTEGGAPVSVIEMAASGMMVVSTTHCDIPGVVIDGVTGLLAPERDADALVGHLRRIVAHPEDWLGMQTAARKHVEAEFDARVQGRRLGETYRAVVGS